jgi:serine/threonine-protein kinase
MIGTSLAGGKYELTRLLGEGGMGAVYEATHTATGRSVAIKVLPERDELSSETPQLSARLAREARAAGSINSEHIVQVLDAGSDPDTGAAYLVMELLEGRDLNRVLREMGLLPPDLAMRIVAQACAGLAKAHEAGVIHRDIKPANLFLADREGGEIVVKILDFGVAKLTVDRLQTDEGAELTRTGAMLGSPHYMSPEQARGRKDIDARTDVWSMGVVLYKMLTGQTPYRHLNADNTLGELILAICSRAPRSVQEAAPWVSKECAMLVHRALRIDSKDRFASAEAMLEATNALLPEGSGLRQDMLRTLQTGERAIVAPRYEPTPTPGVSYDPTLKDSWHSLHQAVGIVSAQQRERSRPRRVAVVVGLAIAAGAGLWLTRDRLRAAVDPQPASAVANQPANAAPVDPSSASPAPAPQTSASTVVLAYAPAEANVEIDGTPATKTATGVELHGALGSTHRVRVSLDKREIVQEVVITEQGAFPSSVALPKAIGSTAPKRATPTVPAPTAPVVAKPPSTALNIQKTFE